MDLCMQGRDQPGMGRGMGWGGCWQGVAANAAPLDRTGALEARLAALESEAGAIRKLLSEEKKK